MKDFNMETENLPENIGILDMDELAKLGAKLMIKQALVAEVESYRQNFANEKTDEGHPAVVRNGYHKERKILLGNGEIEVQVPRTRHRLKPGEKFESIIVPKYIRKSPNLESALPLLYLYGISTNNILPALSSLLGEKAKGLSSGTLSRLKKEWENEYHNWKKREILENYPIIWVDGVYFKVRGSTEKTCMLVVVGANSKGEKEILSMETGFRESTESWNTVFQDLVDRGLTPPKLIIGDGASGLWSSAEKTFPDTKLQRCWVHKIRNVLDKLPKKLQSKAKEILREIMYSPTKEDALKEVKKFKTFFGTKYDKAVETLEKDIDRLLTFFDFPAKLWTHIRTTNVIESMFSQLRSRTDRTKGCLSEKTLEAMVFKLFQVEKKKWRRLRGYQELPKVIKGVIYIDGENQESDIA